MDRRDKSSSMRQVQHSASAQRSVASDDEAGTDLSAISSLTSEQHPLSASVTHKTGAHLLVSIESTFGHSLE